MPLDTPPSRLFFVCVCNVARNQRLIFKLARPQYFRFCFAALCVCVCEGGHEWAGDPSMLLHDFLKSQRDKPPIKRVCIPFFLCLLVDLALCHCDSALLLPFVVRVFMWPIYVATLWVFFNFSWKHAWLKLLLLLPHRPPLSQGFGFPSAASIGQNFRGGTAAGMLQMVKQISCQPIGWAWLENILFFFTSYSPTHQPSVFFF